MICCQYFLNFQNTFYDHSSQAFGSATELIYIPSVSDYVIVPGKYQTSQEIQLILLSKILLIQRNFRRYLLQKFIRESAAEYRYEFYFSEYYSIDINLH